MGYHPANFWLLVLSVLELSQGTACTRQTDGQTPAIIPTGSGHNNSNTMPQTCVHCVIIICELLMCQGKLGELLVSLCYQPTAECITVIVARARELKAKDINGLSGAYTARFTHTVNAYLLQQLVKRGVMTIQGDIPY